MVTQESVLFNDSVYNNILMGKPDATREEVIAAAKIANADDFISNLSEGYDTTSEMTEISFPEDRNKGFLLPERY
jgi:ABC-type multidrug transport system fused ATPase/permease subunit